MDGRAQYAERGGFHTSFGVADSVEVSRARARLDEQLSFNIRFVSALCISYLSIRSTVITSTHEFYL